MMWWLAWVLCAHAEPADALDPLARGFWDRAVAREADGDLRGAATAYRMTWGQDPTWVQALVGEARVLAALGEVQRALEVLDQARFHPEAVEARGRLLLDIDPEAAIEAFQTLKVLRPERDDIELSLAEALAPVRPEAGRAALERYLEAVPEPDAGRVVAVAVALEAGLRAEHAVDAATALAADIVGRFPEAEGSEALLDALRTAEVRVEAARLASAAGVAPSPVAVAGIRDARAQAHAGDLPGALRALEAVVDAEPRVAVGWAALARLRERAGDVAGAVVAAERAESLDPFDADRAALVASLYATHFGGRLDVRAARAYARAVQRRGSDADLWFRKGTLERRVGWTAAAEASFRRVIALEAQGARADAARRQLDGLLRPLPVTQDVPEGLPGRPADVPAVAWEAFHEAWAWQRRSATEPDALERALQAVEVARAAAPSWERALRLEAAIRLDRGEDAAALELYRASLVAEPDQAEVHRIVADLLAVDDPAAARVALERAADLGEPSALLRRAHARAAEGRLWAARADLAAHRERTVDDAEVAQALDRHLARQQAVVWAGAGLTGGALVLGPLAWRRWQRAGVGLDALLVRSPEAWPEVARVLAAIRHEVLKHHTTVLDEVADGLERGEADLGPWAADRLVGDGGAAIRFDGYVAELVRIGERSGVRLNLLHRDPTMGPLMRAMAELTALAPALRRGDAARVPALRRLSIALNLDGYQGLGRLLRRLCLVDVDAGLVEEAWRIVRNEPSVRAVDAHLMLEPPEATYWVRAYRRDLRDVLVNLLRNALEASLADGGAEVGVRLAVDEDWITGLERVEVRVLDRSPRRITTAQVRGRFVGRGLGLAVDLVTRAGGSVHVEAETGWAKAVVVRLPRVERPDEEVA